MVLEKVFVRKLQEALDIHGWSQAELARRMGVTRAMVNHYTSGSKSPGLDMIERFAIALEMENPLNLLDEEPLKIRQPVG